MANAKIKIVQFNNAAIKDDVSKPTFPNTREGQCF